MTPNALGYIERLPCCARLAAVDSETPLVFLLPPALQVQVQLQPQTHVTPPREGAITMHNAVEPRSIFRLACCSCPPSAHEFASTSSPVDMDRPARRGYADAPEDDLQPLLLVMLKILLYLSTHRSVLELHPRPKAADAAAVMCFAPQRASAHGLTRLFSCIVGISEAAAK